MKFAKLLFSFLAVGLLMVLIGTNSASAVVLCKVNVTTSCGSTNHYSAGTEIKSHLLPGSFLRVENGEGIYLERCTGSKLNGTTENTGSALEPVRLKVEAFTFEECVTEGFGALQVIKLGLMEIGNPERSRMTGGGFEFSSNSGYCRNAVSAGSDVGELLGGSPARIRLRMTAPKTSGLFGCTELVILAEYVVETPSPLFVATS